jgi:pyrimidine oxygenase
MDIGVFIPIGNNGWLISTTSPQYKPSFELNKKVVLAAERYGLDFVLSMIKLRGFGGPSEFWDHNLESFTLMAGLAAVTTRIQLFASAPVLAIPPAIVARMAATVDSIAPGRFGVNLVTGWQKAEYDQMGIWPGDEHYTRRYDHLGEYVTVIRELWQTGHSDFKGRFFKMDDCRLSPRPARPIKLVAAGQSGRRCRFAAEFADYNFVIGGGRNKPDSHTEVAARLAAETAKTGRDVGSYVLTMVIADETDEAAWAKWEHYKAGADPIALAWMSGQAAADSRADATAHTNAISRPEGAVNLNMGTFIGSYENVAHMLDAAAEVPGTSGMLLTFDDFLIGIEQFGHRIQPLMKTRVGKAPPAMAFPDRARGASEIVA